MTSKVILNFMKKLRLHNVYILCKLLKLYLKLKLYIPFNIQLKVLGRQILNPNGEYLHKLNMLKIFNLETFLAQPVDIRFFFWENHY